MKRAWVLLAIVITILATIWILGNSARADPDTSVSSTSDGSSTSASPATGSGGETEEPRADEVRRSVIIEPPTDATAALHGNGFLALAPPPDHPDHGVRDLRRVAAGGAGCGGCSGG